MTNEVKVYLPTRILKPGIKWAIGFDDHLASLLSGDGILDPDEQMRICDLFCRLGLAQHRIFGEKETETSVHQEHYYAATGKMRKLMDKS